MKKTVFIKAIWLTFVSLAVILLTVNCQRPEDDIIAPVVKSVAVTNITENSATISGMISFDGRCKIIEQGIYLDETKKIPISFVNSNSIFGITISDLLPNTRHTVKVYAINGVGISFGASIEFTTTSLTLLTFSILNTKISQVETDEDGNVYVTGTTHNVPFDGVVAKFDSSGQLLWSTKISTENYDYPRGGLIIKDNVLYVHANRYDEYGIGAGKLYVDAYNGDSGSLLWSTLVSEGYGSDMALSEDGFIYSVAYIHITKLDLSGNIVSQFTAQGAYGFDVISIYDDNKLFVGGGNLVPIGLESMVWCFDKDLNLLWSNSGVCSQFMAGATSIVSFSEENLLFLGETQGNLVNDIPVAAYVVCYEVKENSLEFKWKKLFGGNCRHPRMMREQSNFYVYSSDYEGLYADDTDGPVLMDIDGNILWTASPKINCYMDTFGNKMYVANGRDKLTIISM